MRRNPGERPKRLQSGPTAGQDLPTCVRYLASPRRLAGPRRGRCLPPPLTHTRTVLWKKTPWANSKLRRSLLNVECSSVFRATKAASTYNAEKQPSYLTIPFSSWGLLDSCKSIFSQIWGHKNTCTPCKRKFRGWQTPQPVACTSACEHCPRRVTLRTKNRLHIYVALFGLSPTSSD